MEKPHPLAHYSPQILRRIIGITSGPLRRQVVWCCGERPKFSWLPSVPPCTFLTGALTKQ